MRTIILTLFCGGVLAQSALASEGELIQRAVGLNGGIIVVLDATDADLLTKLAVAPSMQLQVLLKEPGAIDALRKTLHESGRYGQISVNTYNGSDLPYVDNLVNAVICDKATSMSQEELLRVIAPHGTLHLKSGVHYQQTTKRVPPGMDEWNQFLHDGTNNGVSKDNVGPPQRMRWHNTPEAGRGKALMPSVT